VKPFLVLVLSCLLLSACAPKIGSPEWCENMEAKAKGDWSLNEAKDYAKHCVLK
jgi:hypothetical protein